MRKLAKMLANAVSTACRRRAMGFVVMAVDVLALLGLLWASEEMLEVEPVRERDWRRKLPAEMKAAEDAGVGGGMEAIGCCCCWSSSDSRRFRSSEDFFEWDGGGGGMDVEGATSLAMRASMNVTKVKETLCAGEYARLSRTHAWVSSQDRGGCLAFSRAIICEFMFCHTSAVMIPSLRERRNTIRVSLRISKRCNDDTSGSNMALKDPFVSKASRTEAWYSERSSRSLIVHSSGLKGHPAP